MVRPQKRLVQWKAFENKLLGEFELRTARERLNYARKYSHCLIEADLSELQLLKIDKRHHVMKALSALAKFLGIYEEYKQLIKNYGLKWSVNSDDLIIRRLSKSTDRNKVFKWIDMVKKIEPRLRDFLDFMLVTGLRLKEAVESYNLIIRLAKQGKLSQYYDEEREILEHFKFKEIFIRRTKKAFISFVPKDLVLRIFKNETLTYSFAISMRKKGLKRMFGDLRETHGTFLTKYLSPAEIDFLHGRVSA